MVPTARTPIVTVSASGLATAVGPGTARVTAFAYDAAGNRIQIGDGIVYSYDPGGRMLGASGGGIESVRLAYDPFGRRQTLSSIASGNPTATSSWSYDPVSRLQGLAHDLAGTASDQNLTFAYNPASQIVTRTGSNDLYAYSPSAASTAASCAASATR